MDMTLDPDLSEQLKSCAAGEKITLQGTVTANDQGAVQVTLDSAAPADAEESPEYGNGEAPASTIPGPVQTLLKRK